MTSSRRIGTFAVAPIGLGCMNLTHAYGEPPSIEVARGVLLRALDLGVTHFDCAALYGFGRSESLLGEVLPPFRNRIHLASKCGMTGVNGKRVIDNRPETLKRTLDESLARLRTDVIDLYYLHRWDRNVPLEDSLGALRDMVTAGKVREIGLSEVSAETLRRAHAIHPIAAMQSEYSLWSRNAELAVLQECHRLGIAYVAFSPLGRGFLAGSITQPDSLVAGDLRRSMPRFQPPHWQTNVALLPAYRALAAEAGYTAAQLALAWLLHKAPHIVPIPGTTSTAHLEKNVAAADLQLDAELLLRVEQVVNARTVSGPRYPASTQLEIDTEELTLA
jgi:aryl-alcohol dehydrogenase-like predicted oxidoreductase